MRSAIASVLILMISSLAANADAASIEDALSRLLLGRSYGSTGPILGGINGAYTNPRQVNFWKETPCVFWFSEIGLNENGDHAADWRIDFNKVKVIAVDLVDRPQLDLTATCLSDRAGPEEGHTRDPVGNL